VFKIEKTVALNGYRLFQAYLMLRFGAAIQTFN
jgi:hypothetical protein